MNRLYAFKRVRNSENEMGITSGHSPEEAMRHVLGSHPNKYNVTYAMVYLPDVNDDPNSDFSLEWGKL